jgi:hypothetical protein
MSPMDISPIVSTFLSGWFDFLPKKYSPRLRAPHLLAKTEIQAGEKIFNVCYLRNKLSVYCSYTIASAVF